MRPFTNNSPEPGAVLASFAIIVAAIVTIGCVAEETSQPDVVDLTVSLAPPEFGYQVTTTPSIVPAGTEVEICSVVRVEPHGNEKLIWLNEMESLISDHSHHMNVGLGQFSFYDAFLGEDAFESQLGIGLGNYDCKELDDLMESALPVFPSQRTNQKITLPDRVGAPMLAPLVLVFSHHYINTTDDDLLINAALNIYTVDEDAIDDVAFLVFDSDSDLDIPGGSQKIEAQTCVMHRDLDIALVSTHTHEKTYCATLNDYYSDTTEISEEPFFVNKNWETPPILHFKRGDFPLPASDGIHYACHYSNDEERDITFGPSARDEMCVFAAVAYPAPLSKQAITDIIEQNDINGVLSMAETMIAPCNERIPVASPWPMTEKAGTGSFADTCADFTQTESNTLR